MLLSSATTAEGLQGALSPNAQQFDKALETCTIHSTLAAGIEDCTRVGFKNAAIQALESLNVMQDVMEVTLKDGVGKHAKLLDLFGGDCRRVAMMRGCVEQLQAILGGSHYSKAPQLAKSLQLLQSVEEVIISAQGGNALKFAQKVARRFVTPISPAQHIHPELKEPGRDLDDPVSPIPMHPQQKPDLRQEERAALLKDLDKADSYEERRDIVKQLFEVFDEDGNGELNGDECERAYDDLVMHVLREAAERWAKYGVRLVPRMAVLRQWVRETVDTDGDGKITAQEAVKGFVKVVNDIDEQGERAADISE